MADLLPPLRPIPIKERLSVLYIERGQLDVLDGAFVVVDANGVRTHIPVGGVACLMLEPGTRVSHAAVTLAARVGTLLVWIGEAPPQRRACSPYSREREPPWRCAAGATVPRRPASAGCRARARSTTAGVRYHRADGKQNSPEP